MVLAGLAFTFFSSPNITLTPAFVAGFHNGPCWLGLHLLLLTEHHPHTGFCCWLDPGLDAAKAWESEYTSLLHLLCGNCCKTVQDLRTFFVLHAMLSGNGSDQS